MIGPEQRAHLHARLETERARLARRLTREEAELDAHLQRVADRDPCAILSPVAATDDAAQEVRSRHAEVTTRQIRDVDYALHRLQTEPDDFGVCARCGERISTVRLDVLPATTLCQRCAGGSG